MPTGNGPSGRRGAGPAAWRASAIGTYRFWRDLGYGIGALSLGLAAASSHSIEGAFWFVAAAMALSGLGLNILGEETHPRLNPALRSVDNRGVQRD
jgi:hypothetical protein